MAQRPADERRPTIRTRVWWALTDRRIRDDDFLSAPMARRHALSMAFPGISHLAARTLPCGCRRRIRIVEVDLDCAAGHADWWFDDD
jgi:hypothetical protein